MYMIELLSYQLVISVECTRKSEEKRKRKVSEEELHDDPDFEAMLKSMDEDELKSGSVAKPSPCKKAKTENMSPTKIKKEKEPSPSPKKVISSPMNKKKEIPKKAKVPEKTKDVCKSKPNQLADSTKEKHSFPKLKKESPKKEQEETSKAVVASKAAIQEVSVQSQLWVDKYKPTSLKTVIGQQGDKSNLKKLLAWLRNWPKNNMHNNGKRPSRPPPFARDDDGGWAKAALLSGPPGVGKTTTSYLVAKELGLDVMELNASDTRSKKMLDACLQDALSNLSLSKESKNRVLLMDEVDGMAGNEDRGGMAQLIALIKNSKVPVIW